MSAATEADAFNEIKLHVVKPERCVATPQQEKIWTETRAAFLWNAPAFSAILYSLMTDAKGNTVYWSKEVPIAGTDDRYLYLNPEKFVSYDLEERVFIVAHEVMHAILSHCSQMSMHRNRGKVHLSSGASLPYDQQVMNVACDLVINDILIESKIGKFNKEWLHDPNIITGQDSVVDAYEKLYRKGNGGNTGKGNSFCQHFEPGKGDGKSGQQAKDDRNDAEWKTTVAGAMAAAKARGQLPAGLQRILQEFIEPKVSWIEHLRSLLAKRLGTSSSTWKNLDPQLVVRRIGAPGRLGYGCEKLIVAVDTSGSVTNDMFQQFIAEVASIVDDVRPRDLYLMQCDATVQSIDDCTDTADLFKVQFKGGGGTDFIPVFEKVDDVIGDPDCLVYLTDGFGRFPQKPPRYPVIWGNISPAHYSVKYPFGDVVDIDFSVTR
jgi:predicted metal-dependent peptidase